MNILIYAVCAIIAYLIGGVSIANMLSKKIIGKNIREVGSGNTGASNMIRNCGWGAGLGTLAFDAAKAIGAMVLARWIVGMIAGEKAAEIAMYVAAVSVILGHIWPVFTKFKGGKGVACTFGVVLFMMPIQTTVIFVFCAIITIIFKIMSITSFTGLILVFASAFIFYPGETAFHITMIIIFVIILFTHRSNIVRLVKGKEAKVKISKKDEEQEEKEKEEKDK